ncbi:MAG TPA: hypothetical protein VII23_00745 [Terriglobales bacterium]
MPSLGFLHHPANDAHLHIDNGGADARFHSPFAEIDKILGGDPLKSLRPKEAPRLNKQLFLFLLACIGQVQAPTFEKAISGLAEGQPPELLTYWREFAPRGLRDEFFLPRLRFTPITGIEALAETLPINEEMCVPRFTALY